jgi:photosystem II stability/assembly factor-like uncharacterized protein
MNKLYISFIIIIILNVQIPAQWNYIHNLSQRDFYTIDFVSEQKGFLGGEALIGMTNNEGKTWFNINGAYGNEVLSLAFLDENNGVAVGQYYLYGPGFIYYTTDGGFDWDLGYYLPYAYAAVFDVFVLDNNHGWAVGEDGNVFKIISGIDYWDYVLSLPVDLNAVYFTNQNIGWTAGLGKLYKTTNGGSTWTEKTTGVNSEFYDVYFLNQNIGWATAYPNKLLNSTDGGETWTITTANISFVDKICFITDSLGFVTGNSKILKTTNGGNNWTSITIPGASWFDGISFIDSSTGYISGRYSKLFKTTDSGETWKEMTLGEFNNLNSIDMFSLTRGVAVGDSGTIIKKNNDPWFSGITTTLQDLNSVYTFNQSTAIAVGDSGVIIKSTDNYLNWIEKNPGVNVNLNSVQFIDNNVGWVVGENGIVLKSTNAGESWFTLNSGQNANFNSVFFLNSTTGWISGDNGLIIKSIDGGANWMQQNSGLFVNIFKVEFCDANFGYALAHGGIILKTVNGGTTWSTIYDSYDELKDIEFFNPNIGWVCGQGDIFRTNNGGLSWTHQFDTPYYDFRSLCLLDSSIVFSAGDDGLILLTTNGGQGIPVPVNLISFTAFTRGDEVVLSWSTSTELNNHIFEIERKTKNQEFYTTGYVEGSGTTTEHHDYSYIDRNVERNTYYYRLKQIDFNGMCQYSDQIEVFVSGVLTIKLEQNYPNPFNPVTNIGFTISDFGFVSLKIYDILGNEIATLINEEKQPGTYEVEFDANDLTSGIYFYQLKSGNYLETRKMVMLK